MLHVRRATCDASLKEAETDCMAQDAVQYRATEQMSDSQVNPNIDLLDDKNKIPDYNSNQFQDTVKPEASTQTDEEVVGMEALTGMLQKQAAQQAAQADWYAAALSRARQTEDNLLRMLYEFKQQLPVLAQEVASLRAQVLAPTCSFGVVESAVPLPGVAAPLVDVAAMQEMLDCIPQTSTTDKCAQLMTSNYGKKKMSDNQASLYTDPLDDKNQLSDYASNQFLDDGSDYTRRSDRLEIETGDAASEDDMGFHQQNVQSQIIDPDLNEDTGFHHHNVQSQLNDHDLNEGKDDGLQMVDRFLRVLNVPLSMRDVAERKLDQALSERWRESEFLDFWMARLTCDEDSWPRIQQLQCMLVQLFNQLFVCSGAGAPLSSFDRSV